MNETLGEFIRRIRMEKLDMSLRELASKIQKSAPFVSDIELGRRYPSGEVLADLARVLGVSEDDLRERDVRAPIEEIKRVTLKDPTFAMAFRTVLDKNIPAEKLLEWAKSQQVRKK